MVREKMVDQEDMLPIFENTESEPDMGMRPIYHECEGAVFPMRENEQQDLRSD